MLVLFVKHLSDDIVIELRIRIPLYNFINDFKIKNSMENEVKIKVPDGKKAIQNVDSNGNIVIKFEKVEPIRSKSWEEFCKNHSIVENEWFISSNGHILGPTSGPNNRDVVDDSNFLETKEDAKGILALIKLTRLHDEWVGNWKPNWGDYYIHCIIIQCNSIVIDRFRYEQHTLSFPSYEMAEEFLNCFRD